MAQKITVYVDEDLHPFGLETWEVDPRRCMELASDQVLSVYDAAYLQLVLEAGCVLWTLDQSLAAVAHTKGVPVAP